MKNSIQISFAFIILLLTTSLFGQGIDRNMKADDLTNEQVAQIKVRLAADGMSIAEFESQAIASGASPTEVAKLSARLSQTMSVGSAPANQTTNSSASTPRSVISGSAIVSRGDQPTVNSNIFGSELFNNPSISFEPNQNMPTPKNYILSTGDQLIIDIYGYSEGTYKLTVSPDGFIRIPNVGPISLNGLSIDQAKGRISDHLASHGYSNIRTGSTSVNITLGNIRSIKVTLIGEVSAPGTYTLSSLSTVYTALYSSGGPGKNGSYRDIQLIRDNKVISTIDVYDFLMKGDKSDDLVLKDQDIIKINPYKIRVSLKGEVKRQLIFEAVESDNLQNLLEYAGGFTSDAFKQTISIVRNTERERQIIDVSINDYSISKPANGDCYTIGKILDRYTNRVSIKGSVFRPGSYSLTEGMTLGDLINKADGLREDVYLPKATLFRKGEDLMPVVLSVNLQKVMSGQENVTLQKDDELAVYSKFEIKEAYTLSIRGEVISPVTLLFSENMHIRDMIFLAGGLKENASAELEVSRRIRDANVFDKNSATARVFSYSILSTDDTLVLQPFDEILVKPLPGYKYQIHVSVQGEVACPGTYTLQNSRERISSLVKRAGGLTGAAFQPGAILIRSGNIGLYNPFKDQKAVSAFSKQGNDSLDAFRLEDIIASKTNLVGIQLDKALSNPDSEWDLILEAGDVLSIPKELQTVTVNGQVLFPSRVSYKHGMSLRKYVSGAGGYAENAIPKKIFVVYPNGNVKSTKSVLGIRFYPKVLAGSDIYIPEKKTAQKNQLSSAERTGILISALTAFSTIALLMYSVLK
jgi:protein involved in polysaccharide export with SLBB domain